MARSTANTEQHVLHALRNKAQVLLAAVVFCMAGVSQAAQSTPATQQYVATGCADCAQVGPSSGNGALNTLVKTGKNLDELIRSFQPATLANGGFNGDVLDSETITVGDDDDLAQVFTFDPEFADVGREIDMLLASVKPFRRTFDSGLLLEMLDNGQWYTCAPVGDKHHPGTCDYLNNNANGVAGVKRLHGTSPVDPVLTTPDPGISRWAWPVW